VRPEGYRRRPPLPFDSLDHLVAAAGADLETWRGLRVLADEFGELRPARAPEGEQLPDERGPDRRVTHYLHLV